MKVLGILLIVVAVGLGAAGMLLPKRAVLYSATAVVKVARDKVDLPELTGIANLTTTVGAGAGNTFFIETEIAVIKSDATLNQVITQLNLVEVWSQRLNGGNPLKSFEISQSLKERLQAQPGSENDAIQIRAVSEVANEAADVANAVANAYCDYRMDYRHRVVQTALDALASKYAEKEKQISEQQAKVEQSWQQLDPALQELATTNASTLGSGVLRSLQSQYSESILRHLTASNQLAFFLATNATAEDWVIEQLKSRVEMTKAEMARAEKQTTNEIQRFDRLRDYQLARLELDDLNQRFTPVKRTVEELRNDLRPQSQPPASVVEPATVPGSPDPGNTSRPPWILPAAGVAFLLGVGLLIIGRGPQKSAA